LTAITDAGLMAGNAGSPQQGFLMFGGVVQSVSVPGSSLTEIFGMRQDGTIYGRYIDAGGTDHGFVGFSDHTPVVPSATPSQATARVAAAPVCLSNSRLAACRLLVER